MKLSVALLGFILPLIRAQVPHWGPCPELEVQAAFNLKQVPVVWAERVGWFDGGTRRCAVDDMLERKCLSFLLSVSFKKKKKSCFGYQCLHEDLKAALIGHLSYRVIPVPCSQCCTSSLNMCAYFPLTVHGKMVWNCQTAGPVREGTLHWNQFYFEGRQLHSSGQLRNTVSPIWSFIVQMWSRAVIVAWCTFP